MTRSLVTGANGFTGRHVLRALAERGHEVHALVRRADPGIDDLATTHICDLTDREGLAKVMAEVRPDNVLHLAAIAFVAHDDVFEMYRTNIVGTRCLLESCAGAAHKARSILVASSANVYGNTAEGVLAEDRPLLPANDYGVSKLSVEHLARIYATQLPIIVVRPFNYTGRGQSASYLIPKIVNHVRDRAPGILLGNLDVERDFSDVRSVVDAYVRLIDSSDAIGQTFNICSGRAISLRSILDQAMAIGGHDMEVSVNPALLRSNEIRFLCGDTRRLESVIGPRLDIPFDETLRWMLEA